MGQPLDPVPCPFCSSKHVIPKTVDVNIYVLCKDCGARGPLAKTHDDAIILWNKGSPIPASDAWRLEHDQCIRLEAQLEIAKAQNQSLRELVHNEFITTPCKD